MSDEISQTETHPDAPSTEHHAASERIGDPAVDAVLEEVESVGQLPVQDQVAVYERAHERLRHALDGSGGAADGPGSEPGL